MSVNEMLNEEVCHHNFVLFHQILSFSLKLISPVGSEVNPVSFIIIRPVFCVLPIKKPQEIVMCCPEAPEPSLHMSQAQAGRGDGVGSHAPTPAP